MKKILNFAAFFILIFLMSPIIYANTNVDNVWDIKNLLAGGIGVLAASLLAAAATIIGANWFAERLEEKKLLLQKKEEILLLIFKSVLSLSNIKNFYLGNLRPDYDNYTTHKFGDDLTDMNVNLLTAAALINAHIGKIDDFTLGYTLLLGEDGFTTKRLKFVNDIRAQSVLHREIGNIGYAIDHADIPLAFENAKVSAIN